MEYIVKPYKKFFKEDRRNLIPKAFDKWIEKKFGNFAHFLVQYDVQDDYIYREDVFREDYETDEEYYKATDKLRQSELNDYVSEQEDRYYNWLEKYRSMTFPMNLYRVIKLDASLDQIENLNIDEAFKNGVGVYWTDGTGSMAAYWGHSGGKDYTIRATVNEGDINWGATLYNNMHPALGDEEEEIQLERGTKILLTGIAQGATSNDNEFEPLNVHVRA